MICSLLDSNLATGLIGVAGVLLGLVVERLLRLTGRLVGNASGWEPRFVLGQDGFGGTNLADAAVSEEAARAERVEYQIALDLFNGKEVPTGLREVAVVLVREDGQRIVSRPRDIATARRSEMFGTSHDTLEIVNLPPRQFVRKEMLGWFGKEAAEVLARGSWRRVEFVGELPKRRFWPRARFSVPIAER